MYFEGKPAKEIYLIKIGKVRLTRKFYDRNEVIVDSLGEGEFFGLVAAMERGGQSETATVIEDAYIYALKPADFNDLIAKNLRIGFKLFNSLANLLREYNHKIEKLTRLENEASTADKLLEIGEYYCNNNQPSQAEYVYRKYIELYPDGKLVAEIKNKIQNLQTAPSVDQDQKSGSQPMPDNELFERSSRIYQAGEIILCEFVPGEEMFIIVSGHVKITKITKAGEKVLALLGPGDIIGEMAVINRKLRSATAVATEPSKVVSLTTDNFEQIIARKPQLLVKLIRVLCDRIRFTAGQLQNFAVKSPPGRVAGMLVLLGDSHKKKADQNSLIPLFTSAKDLSQMTGAALPETEAVLGEFVRKEFLKIEEGQIIILDLKNVKAASEFYAKKEHFSAQGM